VEIVQLSPEGELVDHISLSQTMRQDIDKRTFTEFLIKNKPTVIFVGVDGYVWKGLFSHVMVRPKQLLEFVQAVPSHIDIFDL